MNEIALYVLEVVVVPALVAGAVAAPFLLTRLRQRRALVEAGLASALCIAFFLSFVAELDLRAFLRQIVALEGDSAPFERWHRVGFVAAALAPVAWILSAARARLTRTKAALATAAATLVVGGLVGTFVRFPGMTAGGQLLLGVGVPVLAFAFWGARRTLGWAAWVAFGTLAAFSAVDGFASLAVMCGAVSAAGFGVATLGALVRRRDAADDPPAIGGAVFLVPGTLAATLIACGTSYGTLGLGKLWMLAPLALTGDEPLRLIAGRIKGERAKTAIRVAGMLLVAGLLVFLATRSAARDDLLDAYGG